MLRTTVEHYLSTVITFHHRTMEAEAFAKRLLAVARRLNDTDPARLRAGSLQGEGR